MFQRYALSEGECVRFSSTLLSVWGKTERSLFHRNKATLLCPQVGACRTRLCLTTRSIAGAVRFGCGGVLCHRYAVPRKWEIWVMRFRGLAPPATVVPALRAFGGMECARDIMGGRGCASPMAFGGRVRTRHHGGQRLCQPYGLSEGECGRIKAWRQMA